MRLNLLFTILFVLMHAHAASAQQFGWQRQTSGSEASLRGLYVLNDTTVWASGAKGTILRTTDGGDSWQKLAAPADSLDFRSLWAFNANEALIATAGQPARIYRTQDGGEHWQLVYADSTGKGFFDAIAFWDSNRGLALSDPIDGKFLLLTTEDGGMSWTPLHLPSPVEGEAFFAASNGSIALTPQGKAWIGTGGGAIRVMHTPNGGKNWQIQETPLITTSLASGLYALSFASAKQGVAVGGAYDQPNNGTHAALYTLNGGKNWLKAKVPPKGYRSGLALLPGTTTYLAVGTNGTDISRDGGKTWSVLHQENLNSIRFSPSGNKGWAIGPKGTIYAIDINP